MDPPILYGKFNEIHIQMHSSEVLIPPIFGEISI